MHSCSGHSRNEKLRKRLVDFFWFNGSSANEGDCDMERQRVAVAQRELDAAKSNWAKKTGSLTKPKTNWKIELEISKLCRKTMVSRGVILSQFCPLVHLISPFNALPRSSMLKTNNGRNIKSWSVMPGNCEQKYTI